MLDIARGKGCHRGAGPNTTYIRMPVTVVCVTFAFKCDGKVMRGEGGGEMSISVIITAERQQQQARLVHKNIHAN